jgi:copper oxidase (laccase) domain-containing protein
LFYTCASTIPLPETVNIVPPSDEVPPEIAAFSGVWKGTWFGVVDTVLIVEKINTKEADIIISLGPIPGYDTGMYFYTTVSVLPGPSVGNNQNEAKNNNGCTDHKQDKTQNTLQQP